MKITYFPLITLCLFSTTLMAQTTQIERESPVSKKHTFGILMEANHGFKYDGVAFCGDATCLMNENGFGFSLGILYQYAITDFLSLRPQAVITFNGTKKLFENDSLVEEYGNVVLTIPIHLLLKNPKWNRSPHVILGGRYSYEISEQKSEESIFDSTDWSLDMGIGMEWEFQKYGFSSELVSTFGLVNLIENENLDTSFNKNLVAFRLVFRG